MKDYKKPIVLPSSDLSEGVYTASGDVPNYTLTYRGEFMGTKYYTITLINTSDKPTSSMTITVGAYGNIEEWHFTKSGVQCTMNPNETATITYNKRRGYIDNDNIFVSIDGKGDFGLRY